MIEEFTKFCREAYQELRLSSWLSRKAMAGSTVIVMILTLIIAAYVGIIDRILLFFASILFH
jgi:preprotein translocase SecE subunit